MSGTLNPPSSINDLRTQAHLQIGERLANLDLTKILVYIISNVDASVLPFLAWQFDIQSPFWGLLSSTEDQRSLIQNSISLHKYKGTPYAIKQIVSSLGFPVVTIQEGQASWGGNKYPASQGWAAFRVSVSRLVPEVSYPSSWDSVTDVDTLQNVDHLQELLGYSEPAVTATLTEQLLSGILFLKNARSWLDALVFVEPPISDLIPITDIAVVPGVEPQIKISDSLVVQGWSLADTFVISPTYNAQFFHSGLTYGQNEPAIAEGPITINGTLVE